jgi:hypothetical protein
MKPISIVVLPEDSAKDACEILQELVKKMLYLLDQTAPLDSREKIRLEPSTPAARTAFRGNGWQSLRERQKRVDLSQYIQSQLRRSDAEGFVILHMDGDRPYQQSQHGTDSANQRVFTELLVPGLRLALQDRPELLERILLIVPFYSIEAWLYQNTSEALRLYAQHYRTHQADIAQFQQWRQQPELLDEVNQPKGAVSIADRFNLELASRSFPAQRVFDVRKSFYQSVERLRACQPLCRALEAAATELNRT